MQNEGGAGVAGKNNVWAVEEKRAATRSWVITVGGGDAPKYNVFVVTRTVTSNVLLYKPPTTAP